MQSFSFFNKKYNHIIIIIFGLSSMRFPKYITRWQVYPLLSYDSKYFEERGYEIAINEYEYINKVLYIEVDDVIKVDELNITNK